MLKLLILLSIVVLVHSQCIDKCLDDGYDNMTTFYIQRQTSLISDFENISIYQKCSLMACIADSECCSYSNMVELPSSCNVHIMNDMHTSSISICESNTGIEYIRSKCENNDIPYSSFHEFLLYKTPVYSNTSLYKNIYCALCSHEITQDSSLRATLTFTPIFQRLSVKDGDHDFNISRDDDTMFNITDKFVDWHSTLNDKMDHLTPLKLIETLMLYIDHSKRYPQEFSRVIIDIEDIPFNRDMNGCLNVVDKCAIDYKNNTIIDLCANTASHPLLSTLNHGYPIYKNIYCALCNHQNSHLAVNIYSILSPTYFQHAVTVNMNFTILLNSYTTDNNWIRFYLSLDYDIDEKYPFGQNGFCDFILDPNILFYLLDYDHSSYLDWGKFLVNYYARSLFCHIQFFNF